MQHSSQRVQVCIGQVEDTLPTAEQSLSSVQLQPTRTCTAGLDQGELSDTDIGNDSRYIEVAIQETSNGNKFRLLSYTHYLNLPVRVVDHAVLIM